MSRLLRAASVLSVSTRLSIACALVAPALFALPGCEKPAEGEKQAAAVPPGEAWLTATQVREGKIAVEPAADHEVGGVISASGRITFDDQLVTHVYSPVSGRVVKIEAALGQTVKKGDPLAIIDSPDLGSAYSDVVKAQADMIASEHDFKRKKELLDIHAVSQAEYETSEDNFRKSKAELERARLKATMLRMNDDEAVVGGEQYTLRSPIAGKVITRALSPGLQVQGVLAGGTPTEFFTVGQLKRVWVMAEVYEMDLAEVRPGSKVQVNVIAYPKDTFTGKVDWVSSTLDPQLRTAKVRCVIENPLEHLKPEMYATVKIEVPRDNTLSVPKDAVLHLGDSTVVFVQLADGPGGESRFERRPIKLAEDAAGDYLPVEHGLNPGEKVVVSGAILISGLI